MLSERLQTLAAKAVTRLAGRLPPGVTPEDARQEAACEILRWEDRVPPGVAEDAFYVMKAWGTLKDLYARQWRDYYALNPGAIPPHRKRREDGEEHVPTNPMPRPEPSQPSDQDVVMDVREAIGHLGGRKARIMTMVLEGHTHEQIGEVIGLSQPRVSRIVKEAQAELATLLESYR